MFLASMFTKLKINWQLVFIVNLFFLMININSVESQTDVQAEKDKKLLIQGLIEGKVPEASTRTFLTGKDFSSKCPNDCSSLSDLSMTFSKALRDAGYSQQGWYLVDPGSKMKDRSTKVVVVTELEQIFDDGKPRQARERWGNKVSSPSIRSWYDFASTLLKGSPPGKYRAFLFGFSTKIMTNTGPSWTTKETQREVKLRGLRNAIRNGARLPIDESLKNITTKNFHCYVFVYEYTVSPVDGAVKLVESSSLTAQEHLEASGIWKALGGK